MTQYIVILLDNTSVSFCYYENKNTERKLIPLDILKAGIFYAMKENLNIQFVYPSYTLPKDYIEVIDSIDHVDIKPFSNLSSASSNCVKVISDIDNYDSNESCPCVLRVKKNTLFDKFSEIGKMIERHDRLNIIITDVSTFTDDDFTKYKNVLKEWSEILERLYLAKKYPQLNLITDRMVLDQMNNCGAGDTTITLAPDGCFYVCPALYIEEDGYAIGDIEHGLNIKNPQLYKLDHASICRHCDSYQCKRCVWLNRKTTLEVNTPSHEQCVMAHLERNASRNLLYRIRKQGISLPLQEISEIDYLDPFENLKKW